MLNFLKTLIFGSPNKLSKDWRIEYFDTLETLGTYEDNWDDQGSKAPNSIAIANAGLVLVELSNLNFKPDYIDAHCRDDEGIYFYFSNGDYIGDINCQNDGSIDTCCYIDDHVPGDMAKYEFLDFTKEEIPQAVKYVKQFVNNEEIKDSFIINKIAEHRREVGLF